MLRQRIKLATTKKITSEDEELNRLNSAVQKNRERHAIERLIEGYRNLYEAAQAGEHRLRKRGRIHRRRMRVLCRRSFLCIVIMFGVFLSWWFNLVCLEFFLGVSFLCSGISSFYAGIGWEKERQFNRENQLFEKLLREEMN